MTNHIKYISIAIIFLGSCKNATQDEMESINWNLIFNTVLVSATNSEQSCFRNNNGVKSYSVADATYGEVEQDVISKWLDNTDYEKLEINDIVKYQPIDSSEVYITTADKIRNVGISEYYNTIHYMLKNERNNYLGGLLFSNPTISKFKDHFKILIKTTRVFEHPIQECYYLLEYSMKNGIESIKQLPVQSNKVILH